MWDTGSNASTGLDLSCVYNVFAQFAVLFATFSLYSYELTQNGIFNRLAPANNVCYPVELLWETFYNPLSLCDGLSVLGDGIVLKMNTFAFHSLYATFGLFSYASVSLSCCICSFAIFPVIGTFAISVFVAQYFDVCIVRVSSLPLRFRAIQLVVVRLFYSHSSFQLNAPSSKIFLWMSPHAARWARPQTVWPIGWIQFAL